MKNLLSFLLTISLNTFLFSQSIPEKFFDALIYDKENIVQFINKDELEYSERLGIKYEGIMYKVLLTYEIPVEIKEGIISGKYRYEINELPYADTYTRVTFSVPDANYSKAYYFDNGFVTTSTFYSGDWKRKQSKYFNFRLQEPKYFNDYCVKRLDDFVDMMADTLGFTEDEKKLLEKEKIYYTFCADEKEVEKITWFRSKGMALLGNDEVVTAYQTHFHEVAHIVINYKLKNLSLYTLPFFIEGFAVAMGGRGGMAPNVVTDVGVYLQTTGFLTYDSILTNEQFYNTDANMSYALSGLYNMFLFNELGVEKYLTLYKSVNGSLDFVKSIKTENINLPPKEKFEKFLNQYNSKKIMYVDENDTTENKIHLRGPNAEFIINNDYVKFFSSNRFSIGCCETLTDKNYVSRKYNELYNVNENCYYNYTIVVNEKKLDVYSLYNDELIYSYSNSLSINSFEIPKIKGKYEFFLKADLFGTDFQNDIIMIDGTFR